MQHSNASAPTVKSIPFQDDCAWCLDRAGIKPESGSHGICKADSAIIIAQIDQVKAERAERKKEAKA